MKKVSLVVLLSSAVLVGCWFPESTVDASSKDSFEKSLSEISTELEPEQREAFARAVMQLSLNPQGDDKPILSQMAELAAIEEGSGAGVYIRVGPVVDGMTGPEVIKLADSRRVAAFRRQLAALEMEIVGLQEAVMGAKARSRTAAELFDEIAISDARYFWSDDRFLSKPVISFIMRNGSDLALKRVFMRGIVETPGRTIPWIDAEFNHEFPGGLEPGEERSLNLAPNQFGEWGLQELANRDDLVLTLKLLDITRADGTRLAAGPDGATMDQLTSRLASKEAKRDELAAELALQSE